MADKIIAGGLMERGDLCLVEVLGFDWHPGQACGILGKFGQAGISLSYLSIGNGPQGDRNMSFCLSTAKLAEHSHLLDEIQEEFTPTRCVPRSTAFRWWSTPWTGAKRWNACAGSSSGRNE